MRGVWSHDRRWNTAEIASADRFEAWQEMLRETHLAFALDPSPHWREGFGADIRQHQLGAMSLIETSVRPHRGRRTRRQLCSHARDVVGLHFVVSGRQTVEVDGQRLVLGPGDAMIWDGAVTGEYEILEPLRKTTLIIPRATAATVLPNHRNSFAQALSADHSPTRALVRLLALFCEQLPAMSDGARQAAALLVSEMLRPLDELRGGGVDGPVRSDLRERALNYIDLHLQDHALSPATVAAAHGVSVRTLYTAVEGLGVTPGRYIRDRRLDRCREEVLFGADPIASIAHRHGFVSAGHFSTLFRARYGVSPRDARRRRSLS